jgi:glucose/arabinose dehydrogenase
MVRFVIKYRLILILFISVFCNSAIAVTLTSQSIWANGHSTTLNVPEGTKVEYLGSMQGPRFLDLGPDDELLIGSNNAKVYRWRPPYTVSEILVSLPGKNHSVAYRDGELFIAETGTLYRSSYSGLSTDLNATDFTEYVTLPSETGGHWSRTVIVGPDDALYIGIGISSNCADEYLDNSYTFEFRRGGVFKIDEQGGATADLVPYSSGLRNPIGLAFDSRTNKLYATNAGSDDLGFDLPREIFSFLSQGSFHGMPWYQYINGAFQEQNCINTDPPRPVIDARPPSVTFDARSTPEGIAFVHDDALNIAFSGNAIVAIHGSWAKPSGGGNESRRSPKLAMVVFSGNEPQHIEDVVTGFQRSDGSRFARPVGVLIGPDGYLYFTSDGGDVQGLFRLMPAESSNFDLLLWLPSILNRRK